MKRILSLFAAFVWLFPVPSGADTQPAKGRLLVATERVHGEVFAETVILLLHYDETGAMGIVVNRPTEVPPQEVVNRLADYGGRIYWGGPVQMNSLRALMRTDAPPTGADAIVDSVHHVRIDDELMDVAADDDSLRYFIGYAGWSAGQLDRELAMGSWHVVPAKSEHVFADAPRDLWRSLRPPTEYQAKNR